MSTYSADPVRWDHTLIVGDTYSPLTTATLTDGEGVAIDLTLAAGVMEIRTEPGGALLLSPTVSISESPEDGTFTWSSSANDTSELTPQVARYALRMDFGEGGPGVKTILEGLVTIRKTVLDPP